MKFFKLLIFATVALMFINCSSESNEGPSGATAQSFTANTQTFTKTALEQNPRQVNWSKGDVISVFSDKGINQRFALSTTSNGGKTGVFKGNGYPSETYHALYPYASDNKIKDGVIPVSLKAAQSPVADGIDAKANIAVAVSKSETLDFKNITSLLSLTVGNDNVRSIKLRSKTNNQFLAGNADVAFSNSAPVVTVTDGSLTMTMSGNIKKNSRYSFSVYPGEFSALEVIFEFKAGDSDPYPIESVLSLDMNSEYDLGTITVEEPEVDPGTGGSNSEWAAVADSCVYVLIENFMNKNKGTFWGSPQDVKGNSGNLYWQQAHAIDVIIYAYERIRNSNPTLAATYKTYIEKWYQNDANNYNNSKDNEGNYGGFFNAYTDDMAWICLTLLHMTEVLGDNIYADTARDVFDKYMWPRAITDDKGTGLPWTNIADKQGRNSCTNAPACLTAAKLYRKYGQSGHLEKAKTLYNYLTANNLKDDGRVEEPPLTYTQGTFGEACRQLYHITKEQKYMTMAEKVIVYAMTNVRCTNNQILRGEGQDNNQSLFKAVLIPYAVNLVLDSAASAANRETVKTRLIMNGEALRGTLDHSKYPQMYANYYWGTTYVFDGSNYLSMGAQASGASLMENLVRMDLALQTNQ